LEIGEKKRKKNNSASDKDKGIKNENKKLTNPIMGHEPELALTCPN
jgi:hypothetical protein